MVGVPGRSKGCITCRKRKKGCDKRTPTCFQCARAGLQCEGYGRNLVWVNSTVPSGASDALNDDGSIGHDGKASTASRPAPWAARYTKKLSGNHAIILHEPLARTAREQLYVGRFCSASFPCGRPYSSQASNLSPNGWTKLITSFYDSEATLRYTAVALSAAMLGAQSHNSQLCFKGLQAYNRAIQEMGRALASPQRAVGDGLIVAGRVMQLYELFFGYADGWRKHLEGTIAIFLLKGPGAINSEAGHQLFVDSRILAVMLSIGKRTRSPFSTPEWRTLPWRNRTKSPKDKLFDILDDLPGLLEDLDLFQACQDEELAEDLRKDLLLRCRATEVTLHSWKKELGVQLIKYDYTVVGLNLPRPVTDTDFALLHLANLYWVVCLLLYSTMLPISRKPQTRDVSVSNIAAQTQPMGNVQAPQNPYSSIISPKVYASKIARSVHLFFDESAGFFTSGSALFPMTLIIRFFAMTEKPGQQSEESLALYSLLNKPFMGTHVGRFLDDLHSDMSPKSQRSVEPVKVGQPKEKREKIWWYDFMHQEASKGMKKVS